MCVFVCVCVCVRVCVYVCVCVSVCVCVYDYELSGSIEVYKSIFFFFKKIEYFDYVHTASNEDCT